MAKIIKVGNPANESEKKAIQHLANNLPKSWTILHNFELEAKQKLEIDLAVLSPHAVYLVDVKGIRGKFTSNITSQRQRSLGKSISLISN